MKALTVCQPWAHAIVFGSKRIENRTWPTSYRGTLLIHAGKSCKFLGERTFPDGTPVPPKGQLAFGVLLGIVELVDCVPFQEAQSDPWAEGPWCWLLTNPRPVVPLAWRGACGLFEVPDDSVKLLQLGLT